MNIFLKQADALVIALSFLHRDRIMASEGALFAFATRAFIRKELHFIHDTIQTQMKKNLEYEVILITLLKQKFQQSDDQIYILKTLC